MIKLTKRTTKSILIGSIVLTLVACGGGGGGGGVSSFTDSEIKATLVANTFTNWDVYNGKPAVISRYSPDPMTRIVTIRIYLPDASTSDEVDYRQKFLNSVALYNQKFLGYIKLDVINTPLSFDVTNNQGYWRISYNTAFVPTGSSDFQSYCANVSGGPNTGSNSYAPAATTTWTYVNNVLNKMVWWINLSNGRCSLSQDIVTHEIGHALGFTGHFSGFGDGPPISDNFWSTLLTLYKNPLATPIDQVTIYRN